MNEFELITTEKFGDLDCNFYRKEKDILLTREQIGSALQYTDPMIAINKIHNRHKERLDKFSVYTKLVNTDGKKYLTYLYTIKGVMEICRWSRQQKADDFMDFTWEIMTNLFLKENIPNKKESIDYSPIILEIKSLKNDIQSIKYLTNRQQETRKYSKWKYKTTPKIKLLSEYFGETQMTILKNLYIELEDLYNVDLNEYRADYCFEIGVDNCSQFEVIENNKNLRDMFDSIIDSLLEKHGISNEIKENNKRKTIFD